MAACTTLVVVSGVLVSPWLAPGLMKGLWVAGLVALGIQSAAFASRVRWGEAPERLLAVWGWSAGARLLAVMAVAAAVFRFESLHPVTTLVGLAGYLFAMLLLEPVFFGGGSAEIRDGETGIDART